MQRDAKMLGLAIRQRKIAAIDAAIGWVDAGMVVHDRAGACLQQGPAQHACRGDEDGARCELADTGDCVLGIEAINVCSQLSRDGR